MRDWDARVPPQRGDARGSGAALPGSSAAHGAAIGSICSPKSGNRFPPPALPARKLLGPFQRPGAAGTEPGAWVSPVPVRGDLPGTGGIYPMCRDLPGVRGFTPCAGLAPGPKSLGLAALWV